MNQSVIFGAVTVIIAAIAGILFTNDEKKWAAMFAFFSLFALVATIGSIADSIHLRIGELEEKLLKKK
jgi:CDP-diglyceride synthetase